MKALIALVPIQMAAVVLVLSNISKWPQRNRGECAQTSKTNTEKQWSNIEAVARDDSASGSQPTLEIS
jgi:hypothetical protein